MARDRAPWPIKPGFQIWPLISRFAPRARFVTLRQTFARRRHLGWTAKRVGPRAAPICTLVGDPRGAPGADLTASVDLTVFERCDRRHRSAVRQHFIFWTTHWERGRKAEKGRELPGGNCRPRDRDPGAALDAALAAFMDARRGGRLGARATIRRALQ
jgi:hypothetical protein